MIIEGVFRLGQFATANAPSGTEGALYFNTTEKKTKVYSNSAWGDLGGGGGDLWYASGTAAVFDNDVHIGGSLYVGGERLVCPAGQAATDSYCDYVCTNYYVQTGTEGSTSTEYCYNKTGLITLNCGGVGTCKSSNAENCDSQPNNVVQYSCGACKYIDNSVCMDNNVLGGCTNYDITTYCAYNGNNNGATNYHCSNGVCVCDSSGYTTSPDGKDNDCDGLKDETIGWSGSVCAVYGTNKTPRTLCQEKNADTGCSDAPYGGWGGMYKTYNCSGAVENIWWACDHLPVATWPSSYASCIPVKYW